MGADAAIAPLTKCGYFMRSHADNIPPYEPPNAITGRSFFGLIFSASNCAKSASACSDVKYPENSGAENDLLPNGMDFP